MSTFNKKRVIVFRVDNGDQDMYMITLTQALLSVGHDVIIVKNRGMLMQNARQNSLTLNVGTWIPTSIWGYFRSTMHFVRTAYTALWVAFNLKTSDSEPTIVFSDAGVVAIPILRNFGRFQVIHMNHYRELMTNFRPFNPDTAMASRFWGSLQRLCISSAELILVPCESVCRLLNIYEEDERVRVLYPPAEAEQTDFCHIPVAGGNNHIRRHYFRPNPIVHFALRNLFVFVAVGNYEPDSNFEILISAFEMAVYYFNFLEQRCIQLEIIGICNSEAHREYLRKLLAQVAQLSGNIASLINLRSNVSFDERCIAYRRACAVLNANVRDLYVPSIIEALFFAKVVITVDSEFATEVITNETNGIIVQMPTNQEFYDEEFAYAIHNLLLHQGLTYGFIGRAALDEYYDVYSFRNFISRVDRFIRS